jgi:hypothetical protein
MTVKVIWDDGPAGPQPPVPTWQLKLFHPMCAESLAEQGELFPGFLGPAPTRPRPPGPAGQGQLFE